MSLPSLGWMWTRPRTIMFPCSNIHTHDKSLCNAIINIYPHEQLIEGAIHSVGIHPWHTIDIDNSTIEKLSSLAFNSQVIAIGETGLDALKGAPIEKQIDIFKLHISLSEQTKKPLIIHCVKSFNELIALKKQIRPSMPWIIHGFRGKPQLARQLLDNGFYISLGEKFNTKTAAIIPTNRLLFETDESTLNINTIIENINRYRDP